MFLTVQHLILDCNTGEGAIAWAVRQWLFFCAVSLYAGVLLEMTVQEKMKGILSVLSIPSAYPLFWYFHGWLILNTNTFLQTNFVKLI